MVDILADHSDSSDVEYNDEDVAIVQVLSFFASNHSMNAQACALALELQDLDDDNLPDHLEGDFSVDNRRPVYDFLEKVVSGPASIFYNQSGFTLDEWRVNRQNSL